MKKCLWRLNNCFNYTINSLTYIVTICNVAQTFIYNTYCNIDIRRG